MANELFWKGPGGGGVGIDVTENYINRLYTGSDQADNWHELNPDTLVKINTVATTSFESPKDMGGVDSRLFGVSSNNVREYNPDTLVSINVNAVPISTVTTGCGGASGLQELYLSRSNANNVWEVGLDSLVVITTFSPPGGSEFVAVGGTKSNNRMYSQNRTTDLYYEQQLDFSAVINSGAVGQLEPTGVGGMGVRLFGCTQASEFYYEINPDTLGVINSLADPDSGRPDAMGGISILNYILTITELIDGLTASQVIKIVYDSDDYIN